MAMNAALGLRPEAVWDLLLATIDDPASIGLLVKDALTRRLRFYDDFNRPEEDTDVWTSGGDAGTFLLSTAGLQPTAWRLTTGGTINDDRYIHGRDVINNKMFTPYEEGIDTVTWEARVRVNQATVLSAFIGTLRDAITDYAEPPSSCAHFLIDPVITNTFRARTRAAAEEETDTLVALDTDWHTFRIVWTIASVLFYIDDVLVATHAAQVPNCAHTSEFLIRTEAAGLKWMDIDYVHVELG